MILLKSTRALLLLTVLASQAILAQAKTQVFACEPEWAALATEIGGDKLKVYSATTASQDPHHIQARPSLIAKARQADLIICSGSELEVGWLPLLLRQSGNSKIQPSQDGYFMASEQVALIEVPKALDRSMGDVHAAGNQHVHLDPYLLLTIAEKLSLRLSTIDPSNSTHYRENFANFSQRWQAATKRWEAMAQPLNGKNAIVYHKSFSYFLHWLNIHGLADLEPLPGMPPTAKHLAELLAISQQEHIDFIIYAAYKNTKAVDWLSKRSDIKPVALAYTVGGSPQSSDLFKLYEGMIEQLLAALGEATP
jgi:zinc/manganese transport system substrate-binding protein